VKKTLSGQSAVLVHRVDLYPEALRHVRGLHRPTGQPQSCHSIGYHKELYVTDRKQST
jgi:hypothetical protein